MPALDDRCSQHFRYRDLIECGATWQRLTKAGTRVDNRPAQPETWKAIAGLCRHVLDPVVERFGPIELMYGFASSALTRHIRSRIAPRIDQHAGHEQRRDGKLICPRLGQAADVMVPGASAVDVARWLVEHTPFDRLYLYGRDLPLHVSWGPDDSRLVVEMSTGRDGRRRPAGTWSRHAWLTVDR